MSPGRLTVDPPASSPTNHNDRNKEDGDGLSLASTPSIIYTHNHPLDVSQITIPVASPPDPQGRCQHTAQDIKQSRRSVERNELDWDGRPALQPNTGEILRDRTGSVFGCSFDIPGNRSDQEKKSCTTFLCLLVLMLIAGGVVLWVTAEITK